MSEPMHRYNYNHMGQWFREDINMSYFDKNRLMYDSYLCIFFDVCKSVHHHTIQIIQPTRCNSFTS